MVTVYLAPDWGMAHRIYGELCAEFDDGEVRVVGPWSIGKVHGTVLAIDSDRLPAEWNGSVMWLRELPAGDGRDGWGAKLAPLPDPELVHAARRAIAEVVGQR